MKKTGDFRAIATLLRISKKQHFKFFVSISLIIAANISGTLGAYLVGRLIQEGLRASDYDRALELGALVLLCEIGLIVIYYFGQRLLAQASLESILNLRDQLFSKLERLPLSYFDREPVGRTVTRLTHDVESLEEFFSGSMPRLASATLSLVTVAIAMLLTNFTIGIWIFLSVLPAVAVTLASKKKMRDLNREYSKGNSAINSKLNEFLNGIPVIRSFGLENWSQVEFDKEANKFLDSAIRINHMNSWLRPTVSLLAALPMVLLILIGIPKMIAGALTVGTFVTFFRYSERFYRPVYIISQEVHKVQSAFAYLERVLTLLEEREENAELIQGPADAPSGAWKIEFKNLSMQYQSAKQPTLKRLNLNISAHEKIGVLGRTGSGKSSLVGLISRLYGFQEGSLTINDLPIETIQRDSLRSAIAFVSQDVVIFEGSIRDNLCFGRKMKDEELLTACEKSGFLICMRKNNLGLESPLLDRGENLSAGERQLLSITRIFLNSPSLIILDEATANIDERFEELIQAALEKLMTKSTCIVIAHREKTLNLCDRVIQIAEGRIL